VIDHPCPFPEEIPDRLIQLYSYKSDVVLDPFAGSGQTLKAAKHLKRKYVGYETIEKYTQLAKARLKGKSAIRPQQLIARFDKIGKDDPAGQSS
jgi:modification methylase